MRVMLVTGSFPPLRCGVGDYSWHLANSVAMSSSATTVDVVTSNGATPEGLVEGVRIAGVLGSWGIGSAVELFRLIKQSKPDLVHVQYPTQGYRRGVLPDLAPLLARMARVPVVVTWHEPIRVRAIPRLLAQLLAGPVAIVVRSDFRNRSPRLTRSLLLHKKIEYIMGGSALPVVRLSGAAKAELHERFSRGQPRLIVFFGFIYRHKGVDLLFDIADPATDHIVIIGDMATDPVYSQSLRDLAAGEWSNKVTFTGFVPASDAAALLAAADAVVLPFRDGGGDWNSSLHAARAQGTFVVTTSKTPTGLDQSTNTFFAPVDDRVAMKRALREGSGLSGTEAIDSEPGADWKEVGRRHLAIYRQSLRQSTPANVLRE